MSNSVVWPDEILHGIHIGEHEFCPDKLIDEIEERFKSGNMNYAIIRPYLGVEEHYFIEWAQYFAQHEIYFMFLYSLRLNDEGKLESVLNSDLVKRIKDIAGKWFLGDLLGEPGSSYTFKSDGYFEKKGHRPRPQQNLKSMQEAKENYIKEVSKYVSFDRNIGIDTISCVEATIFSHYNVEAGVDIPIMEMMIGNPDLQTSAVRGFAKAHQTASWGTYVAHEWYGGMHHSDILKQKRLRHIYPYAYMSGSNIFCLESGDESLSSFGTKYDCDHLYCRQYKDELNNFGELLKNDIRPEGGPKVKVAFIYGNLDGWGGVPMGSTVWGQLEEKEWGYNGAEYSWKILEDIAHSADWSETSSFGDYDYSSHIPYGMYDIIPANTAPEILKEYEYIFFVGHNTMTPEIYNNLIQYVKAGGRLFMTAAHLNTNPQRGGEISIINGGDVSELFGCILGESFSTREGVKFKRKSIIPDMLYPGTVDYTKNHCDPFYSAGYANYARTTLCGAEAAAVFDNRFLASQECGEMGIAMTENALGNGFALLLTSLDYPGHGAVYSLYKVILRNMLNHCHKNCDVKLLGSDKVKFAVYENYKVYMLNTDFDCKAFVTLKYKDKQEDVLLEPGEFKSVQL